jgi:V/A-type H+-transporting ATPase subunit D
MLSELKTKLHRHESILPLYSEFPEIVSIDKIIMEAKKIAGVRVPIFDHVKYITEEISFFKNPSWFIEGIIIFKEITSLKVKIITEEKTILILEKARRKTTQKVNLYEKVQIPYFEEAIKKIKRFLEDEENLDKSGQKIVKKRLELAQVVVN